MKTEAVEQTTYKTCSRCGETKPATKAFFRKGMGGKHSLRGVCSNCSRPRREYQAPAGMKCCRRCEVLKPATLEFFATNKVNKDGLSSWCKECKSAYGQQTYSRDLEASRAKKREVRAKDPERFREYQARYVNKPGIREARRVNARATYDPQKSRQYWLGFYAIHRARLIEKQRQRRLENPETAKDVQRRSWQKNPMRLRMAKRRRRAREWAAEGTHTATEWKNKLLEYKGRCHWCHEVINGTAQADHVIPLSRGGSDYISNIVPSCETCNKRKGAKMPDEWCAISKEI